MQVSNVRNAYMAVPNTNVAKNSSVASETNINFGSDTVEISKEAQQAKLEMENREFYGDKTYELMKVRGLSDEDIKEYSAIVTDAKSATDKRQFLYGLDDKQRDLVKRANSYGSRLTDSTIASFSDEGVYNMLTSQKHRDYKDFNNDGIVEHGAAMTLVFPPPNAPDHVHEAYEELSKDWDLKDKLLFEGYFMNQSFSANIRYDANGQANGFYEPGDPEYVNIYEGNNNANWREIIDNAYEYFDFLDYIGEPRPEDRQKMQDFDKLIFGGN